MRPSIELPQTFFVVVPGARGGICPLSLVDWGIFSRE